MIVMRIRSCLASEVTCLRRSWSRASSSFSPAFPVKNRENAEMVARPFREWFLSGRLEIFNKIYAIIGVEAGDDLASRNKVDSALADLGLHMTEEFVLGVLDHASDILSCLKFFDWSGRQPGFFHTRVTFTRILKIMSRLKNKQDFMMRFLEEYMGDRFMCRARSNTVLVIGYAMAGRVESSLHVLSKMRYGGSDIDKFSYHVLLNALVEEGRFEIADVISRHISMRGFECGVTHTILMKALCKQNRTREAETYFRGLVSEEKSFTGYTLYYLFDALCRNREFANVKTLLEELSNLAIVPVEYMYGAYMGGLLRSGDTADGALEFFRSRRLLEGYVPDLFRYNMLVSKLLSEDRLEEVFDLLTDMRENGIVPDNVTMNVVLCFFCKAGMVEVALELYASRSEFGLTPNAMAYNYLINTLSRGGDVDEAYGVLKTSTAYGHFPKRRTFALLADALCRLGRTEKMRDLIVLALEESFMPGDDVYEKFIAALCDDGRVDDAYLIHGMLTRVTGVRLSEAAYVDIVRGCRKIDRPDIASGLLTDMLRAGIHPTQGLLTDVLSSSSGLEFRGLLSAYAARYGHSHAVYNAFIAAAPETREGISSARDVYDAMASNGVGHNLLSHNLMLQAYLRGGRISDASGLFFGIADPARKLYSTMIYGMCRAGKAEEAVGLLRRMRDRGFIPSLQSLEELTLLLCSRRDYDELFCVLVDVRDHGISVSSFIFNQLLLHSLRGIGLYRACGGEGSTEFLGPDLAGLVRAFSFSDEVPAHPDELEYHVRRCFQPNTFSYNMILKKVSEQHCAALAASYLTALLSKGFEPNQWSYFIVIDGLQKRGDFAEADVWCARMIREGLRPPPTPSRCYRPF